jgi:hypothetical protein
LNHSPEIEIRKSVARIESDPVLALDHEISYQAAEDFAFCGQQDTALAQLQKAIEGKYCSYPAMDKDPIFAGIRARREFDQLRRAGIQCQQNFLSHRKRFDSASNHQ